LNRPGLIVCPKTLRKSWEETQRLPGSDLWNFGGIRGRDEAREVRQLTIVSRTLPSVTDAEITAETIFSRAVERLPAGGRYKKLPIGRLMADGSGRRVLAYRHPDPDVEAVRFSICEGELLQAIGRGRGVRRTADNPLDVLVMTDVPIPLPVNTTFSWEDLRDGAGPIEVLAARGVIPLDYAGIAAALPDWFSDDAAATEWFQYRREAFVRLRDLRAKARVARVIEIAEFLGNPLKDTMEDSQKLSVFRYHRAVTRQSNLVLVDTNKHRDPHTAIRRVLGPVHVLTARRML
jgi:hypothetical protein